MILLSNGGTNIQRAQARLRHDPVGTVDGVALLARSRARLDRQASRAARRVRLAASPRSTTARCSPRRAASAWRAARRRHQVGLGERGPGASRVLVCRAGKLRAATWCSPARCRRISTSARTKASPGANSRRSATPRPSTNGRSHRRRASVTSRTSCSTATACWSGSRSARCRCRTDFGAELHGAAGRSGSAGV